MSLGDHVGCRSTEYFITLRISTTDARAINAAMVTILLGMLYSTDLHKTKSVLPENPNLYLPTKFFPLTRTVHKL